jgi:hypothetical protein
MSAFSFAAMFSVLYLTDQQQFKAVEMLRAHVHL